MSREIGNTYVTSLVTSRNLFSQAPYNQCVKDTLECIATTLCKAISRLKNLHLKLGTEYFCLYERTSGNNRFT